MINKIKINIAFSGGAAINLSLIGALKYFEENKEQFEIISLSGNSMGAIIAACWSCGINHLEISKLLKKLNMRKLNLMNSKNIFKKIYALFYSRNILSKNIRKLFKEKLNWEIVKIPLTICSTNLSKQKPDYFSSDKDNHLKLYEIVYNSMNIPIVFKNYPCRDIFNEKIYYFDGMFFDNNAGGNLKYGDYNLLLQSYDKSAFIKQNTKKLNFISKYISLLECMLLAGEFYDEEKFTDIVNIGTGAKNVFDFSDEAIDKSIEIGYNSIKKYFLLKK